VLLGGHWIITEPVFLPLKQKCSSYERERLRRGVVPGRCLLGALILLAAFAILRLLQLL
jgi:hypothetical protein